MSGDSNNEKSLNGSDDSLELRKLAGAAGSDKPVSAPSNDVSEKEQASASAKLSEAANTTPVKLVAMEAKFDTSVPLPAEGDKPVSGEVPAAAEVESKPIKNANDVYDHLFDSTLTPGQTQEQSESRQGSMLLKAGIEKQVHLKAQKADKDTDHATKVASEETKAKSEIVDDKVSPAPAVAKVDDTTLPVTEIVPLDAKDLQLSLPESYLADHQGTTILSDQANARVPFNSKNKVALHLNLSENIYDDVPKQPAENKHKKPEITKEAETKIAKSDAPVRGAEFNIVKDFAPGAGKAVDQSGKTIGYWFDNGRKLVMSVSIDANPADQTTGKDDQVKPTPKAPLIASTAPITPSITPPITPLKFVPSDNRTDFPAASPLEHPTTQIPPRLISADPVRVDRSAEKPVDSPVTTDNLSEAEAIAPVLTTRDAARAADNITQTVAKVQEHVTANNPLGSALEQKASAVQRDVHDVLSTTGVKQAKAVASLEHSARDYNKLVETNKATHIVAEKLKISSADVNVLKLAAETGSLESRTSRVQNIERLATKAAGLIASLDPAHANLLKTFDLIDRAREKDISRLYRTGMILGLATNISLSVERHAGLSASTISRVIATATDVTSPRLDFAPERDTLSINQENRAATPVSAATALDGPVIRLDNAVNPIFSALAQTAGLQESIETKTRLVEERAENQRLEQLPDWMKEIGHRIALSPGAPPASESTSKLVIPMTPWLRGRGMGDARVVAPTWKPLSTMGDKHTLAGEMQGIARVLGGFDAVSLARYNNVIKLLQTTDDKVAAPMTAKSNLLSRYPFLAADPAKRQSAIFARPDSSGDFGGALSLASPSSATATMANPVIASAAGQSDPANSQTSLPPGSNQDEES